MKNTTPPPAVSTNQEPTKSIQYAREHNERVKAMLVQLENVFAGMDQADANELFAMNTLCLAGVRECLQDAHDIHNLLDQALVMLKGGAE